MGTPVSYTSLVFLSSPLLTMRKQYLTALGIAALWLLLALPACRRAVPPLPPLPEAPPERVSVLFLGLAGGEGALVQTPGGNALLIDAGAARDTPAVLEALRRRGVSRLMGVVATHPDPVHVGGIPRLLSQIPADWLMDSGFPDLEAPGVPAALKRSVEGRLARELVERAPARGVEYRLGRAGQEIPVESGVRLQVLGPSEPFIQGSGRDANNASVVLRLLHGRIRFLFTADMGPEQQERILHSPQSRWLPADVLQVSDPGTALNAALVERVRPRLVVLTGVDPPSPDEAVTALLEKLGAQVRRVAPGDSLLVSSDAQQFEIEPGATSAGQEAVAANAPASAP